MYSFINTAIFIIVCSLLSQVSAGEVSYNRDIRPILSDKCFHCHGPDAKDIKGSLQLHTFEHASKKLGKNKNRQAVFPESLKKSELYKRIMTDDQDDLMPPVDSHKSLTNKEKELLKKWLLSGAKYESHWAYLKVKRPALPSNNQANPIDSFIVEKLHHNELIISPRANLRTLIRRLSFDLTGLPPTPDQVQEFISDKSKDAYANLVKKLLASKHYGERMAQVWLDGARYADTTGYAADKNRTMWLYRDWVIKAYNDNMPFDQFTIEQLAGDMLPNATVSQKIATGFHRNSMQALGANPPKEEFRVKGIVDRIDTTGRVWLGLTLACAECHDHKYDQISQKEYYQLYAIFNNIPHYGKEFGVHGPRLDVDSAALIKKPEIKNKPLNKPVAKNKQSPRVILQKILLESQSKSPAIAHWTFNGTSKGQIAITKASHSFSNENPLEKGKSLQLKRPQFLHVPKNNKLNITGDIAISTWIKTRSNVGNIVSKYDAASGQRSYVFGIGAENHKNPGRPGHLFAWISSTANTWNGIEIHGSIPVNDGQWHHVALHFQAGKQIRLFVDGILDSKAKTSGKIPASIAVSDRDLLIGAGYNKTKSFFLDGNLSNLRITKNLSWEKHPDLKRLHQAMGKLPRVKPLVKNKPIQAQVMIEMPQPRKTYIHLRGNFESHGEQVFPAVPQALGSISKSTKVNRLSFARWLVDGKNPLVARVIVNRLWQQIFGTGLVKTVEDFGSQGEWPSHPKLLDWLAAEFVKSGWDTKHMINLMVNSQTYQQRSNISPEILKKDFYNRLLSHAPRYRLNAEQIRDNILVTSGMFYDKLGGPSVFPVQDKHIGQFRDGTAGKWRASQGRDRYRRALYTYWQRMYLYPSMAIFDAPTREQSCVRRSRSNTPLQALVTLNDPVFVDAALHFASRILNEKKLTSDQARLNFAFQCALSRPSDKSELAMYLAFLKKQRSDFKINSQSAAQLVSGSKSTLAKDELAAWFMVCSTLLNLDEAVTKQ